MVQDRERLGATFDQAAERYLDARPAYPARLFDRLLALTGLAPGDRVLEVGAGPGVATLPLAQRGLRVTALEPGPALAARARTHLAGYPAEVVGSTFEAWDTSPGTFAAVVSATAWHWTDPEQRYVRAARALRADGHLAVWSAGHVFPPGGDPFFAELQEVYVALGEGAADEPRPAPGELPELTSEIEASGLFEVVAVEHLDWVVDYDAEAYVRLLSTFSGHLAMAPERRARLFAEVRRRVGQRPDRRVRRGWGAVLHVARLADTVSARS